MTNPDAKKVQPVKLYPTIGCCGLDCGLCPRYYTAGTSRCPGRCGPDFFNKHPSCAFITCCVKKRGLEVCAQCAEFPCPRFEGWTGDSDDIPYSFLTHKRAAPNLNFIKEHGIEEFIGQQKKRIELLETMLEEFDGGRSKSFYCIAVTLLPITDLEASLNEAKQEIDKPYIVPDDIKARANILRKFLNGFAGERGIELRLRSKG